MDSATTRIDELIRELANNGELCDDGESTVATGWVLYIEHADAHGDRYTINYPPLPVSRLVGMARLLTLSVENIDPRETQSDSEPL